VSTSPFAPVTDAELAQARSDPAFRQTLLSQNLDVLLARLKSLRSNGPSQRAEKGSDKGANQIREGVELAVKLAELIQAPAKP
jgi:hypothetical protein